MPDVHERAKTFADHLVEAMRRDERIPKVEGLYEAGRITATLSFLAGWQECEQEQMLKQVANAAR